jgi:hypothetical protein
MNIFKQVYKSLYSPKDIASFRFQGIGKTILFVFFLTILSILPSVYFFNTAISTGIGTASSIIKNDLPPFSISNGQLHTKSSVPVTINKENFTIFLDSTGAITEKKLEMTDNGLALLKNKVVIIVGGKQETYPYSMMDTFKISNQDLLNLIDSLNGVKFIIFPIIALFIYLLSSASIFIEISILALIGLGLKNMTGRKLNYRQLWRMAAYSETLPTLFFTIMAALKTTVPSSFLINWFVAILVLLLAINETPKLKKPELK